MSEEKHSAAAPCEDDKCGECGLVGLDVLGDASKMHRSFGCRLRMTEAEGMAEGNSNAFEKVTTSQGRLYGAAH
jgi:hypothetical protein